MRRQTVRVEGDLASLSEVYGAVIGGLVAVVLAAIAWLIRDWRVVGVVYAFLGVIAGLVLLAAADAWP